MDDDLKVKGSQFIGGPVDAKEEAEKKRKLEMFRKVRADIK